MANRKDGEQNITKTNDAVQGKRMNTCTVVSKEMGTGAYLIHVIKKKTKNANLD